MSAVSTKRKPFPFSLDLASGVPVYRQIIDQVTAGLASGALAAGDQLPTVRQLAVDLSINPNTVIRSYRELELRGFLDTQQGTGTFIRLQTAEPDSDDRVRRLDQFVCDVMARAGSAGFTLAELLDRLQHLRPDSDSKRR